MTKRNIEWTVTAQKDLYGHFKYILEHNKEAALKVREKILEAVFNLGEMPIGRPSEKTAIYERVITKYPYIIVYKIEETRVIILRVFHAAQNWQATE